MKSTNRKPRILGITIAAVILVVLGLAAYKIIELTTLQKMVEEFSLPPAAVNIVEPREIAWRQERTVAGFVGAAQSTPVTTDVPGLVVAVQFESGQAVRQGDPLVKLDDSLERIRLKGIHAELNAVEAEFARAQRLHQSSAISNADWETVRAKRDAALSQKDELERVIEKKVIKAPFEGVVSFRDVHPGRYVAEGDALAELVSQTGPKLRFSVNVNDLQQLSKGTIVSFSAGTTNGTARIFALSPSVRSETRQVDIEAAIEGECLLPAGAFVKVRVPLSETKHLLGVPVTALKSRAGEPIVFLAITQGGKTHVEARTVKVGPYAGDLRLIEAGLKPGDHVVSTGAFKLKDGDAVTVKEAPQPSAKLNPHPAKS